MRHVCRLLGLRQCDLSHHDVLARLEDVLISLEQNANDCTWVNEKVYVVSLAVPVIVDVHAYLCHVISGASRMPMTWTIHPSIASPSVWYTGNLPYMHPHRGRKAPGPAVESVLTPA